MLRRAILGSSAALAAFVLVLTGAVLGARHAPPAVRPSGAVPVEVVLAREAALRRLIDAANAKPPPASGFQTASAKVADTDDADFVAEHHAEKHHAEKHHSEKHHDD